MGDQTCYTDEAVDEFRTRLLNTSLSQLYRIYFVDSAMEFIQVEDPRDDQFETVPARTRIYTGSVPADEYQFGDSKTIQSIVTQLELDALHTLRSQLDMHCVSRDYDAADVVLNAVKSAEEAVWGGRDAVDTVVAPDSVIAPHVAPDNQDKIIRRYDYIQHKLEEFFCSSYRLVRDTSGLLGSYEMIVANTDRLGYEVVNTTNVDAGIGVELHPDSTPNSMLEMWTERDFVVTDENAGVVVVAQ